MRIVVAYKWTCDPEEATVAPTARWTGAGRSRASAPTTPWPSSWPAGWPTRPAPS